MSAPVELHPAFSWDCPSCGVGNFARAVVMELSDDDRQNMREVHGIDDAQTGDFLLAPSEVKCSSCGEEFKAKDQRETP